MTLPRQHPPRTLHTDENRLARFMANEILRYAPLAARNAISGLTSSVARSRPKDLG
jgi:hypothetical protein